MPKIRLDGTEYHTEDLSEEGRARFATLQYLEVQLDKLRQEIVAFELAKQSYAVELRAELDASGVTPTPVQDTP